ncbi:hypothetical protein [Propionivibrio sp.]|uniref:hypothetical protein n=1 Tax=Propionivibrio sp. TaxID=2212460 RepID=UPI003BF29D9E
MDKKTPDLPEGKPSAAAKRSDYSQFEITLRHVRILVALNVRSQKREQIDRIAGASNGPDEILRLRKKLDIEIPCVRIPAFDRDGKDIKQGVYSLTAADGRKISKFWAGRKAWLESRQKGSVSPDMILGMCVWLSGLVMGSGLNALWRLL